MQAKTGDIIYCDPPYVPLTLTANFTQYSMAKFTLAEQTNLAAWAKSLTKKNISLIISNHDTNFTRELYRDATLYYFKVQRNISSKGSTRSLANELLAVY